MSKLFLFYGFGSEYVLHPLCVEMVKRGYDCFELDANRTPITKALIERFRSRDLVLITSAHFALDNRSFNEIYDTGKFYLSPLELISVLTPNTSVFVPHDLATPLVDIEPLLMDQFDLYLAPTSAHRYDVGRCNCHVTGWIRYTREFPRDSYNTLNALWLFSDFGYHQHRFGVKKTFRKMEPVVRQGVAVKFPAWTGTRQYEDYFASKGVEIFPSETDTMELIHKHRVIVTNSESSVVAESYYYGKPTVNIIEKYKGNKQRVLFNKLKQLTFIEDTAQFDIAAIDTGHSSTRELKPFDFAEAIKLLDGQPQPA